MTARDVWIETPFGRLFARRVSPATACGLAPIVMLHDSLGCVDLWGSLPRQLSERTSRDVIAYDRLGYGRSDRRNHPLERDFIREEVRAFFPHVREQLDLDRFALLGHSVGGGMAITLAALEPESCVGVISESAQAIVEPRTISGIAAARRALEDADKFSRLAAVHGEKTQSIIDTWSRAWLALEHEDWCLTKRLPPLEVPLLVIHGDQDEFGSRANPDALQRWGKDLTTVEIFEKTRHIPHREKKDDFLNSVRRFLAELR